MVRSGDGGRGLGRGGVGQVRWGFGCGLRVGGRGGGVGRVSTLGLGALRKEAGRRGGVFRRRCGSARGYGTTRSDMVVGPGTPAPPLVNSTRTWPSRRGCRIRGQQDGQIDKAGCGIRTLVDFTASRAANSTVADRRAEVVFPACPQQLRAKPRAVTRGNAGTAEDRPARFRNTEWVTTSRSIKVHHGAEPASSRGPLRAAAPSSPPDSPQNAARCSATATPPPPRGPRPRCTCRGARGGAS